MIFHVFKSFSDDLLPCKSSSRFKTTILNSSLKLGHLDSSIDFLLYDVGLEEEV